MALEIITIDFECFLTLIFAARMALPKAITSSFKSLEDVEQPIR